MNAALADRLALADQSITAALVPVLCRSFALRRDLGGAEAAARSLGAPPDMVARIKDVAASSMTGNPMLAGNSGGAVAFIQRVSEASLLARMIADNAESKVPLGTVLAGMAADVSAYVVGQGQPIPLSPLIFDGRLVDPIKIATMVVTTRDLWERTSSEGQAFINNLLQQAVARAADTSFFSRFVTGATPTFMASGAGLPNADDVAYALREALDVVHVQPGRIYVAASPAAANLLAALPADRGFNAFTGAVAGFPAVITPGLTGRRMVLVDARGFVGNLEEVRIEAADQTSLSMSEAPTNDATTPTGTHLVSLWQTNSRAVRVVLNLGFEALRDNAVAVIDLNEAA